MSKFGLKIKNIEAGILYEYNLGVRDYFEYTGAMLTKSLFYDFLVENGLNIHREESTRDVICIKFGFGASSYEDQIKKIKKSRKKAAKIKDEAERERKLKCLDELAARSESRKHLYDKKSVDELRQLFYKDGVSITYPSYDRKHDETIHYRMLYRTAGKAKQGNCMFINEKLYDKAYNFLTMGINLPEENAPIVEIAAYSSLVTSTIVDKIQIKPEQILILKDVDRTMTTDVISIETDEDKHCVAKHLKDYVLKNTMFDGQALIDTSIVPEWADGYMLLRHHFFKAAAFHTHIQKFFIDYFGDDYKTATVTDMWGNKRKAKDVKLITTENAIKWIKFDVGFDYWADWVRSNNSMFGIVKTAHESKLGKVQQMSYQMVNSLNMDAMENIAETSVNYIEELKTNDKVFLDYLRKNVNFSNDFECLVALYEQNPNIINTEYFIDRRNNIVHAYVNRFKNGKVIQNGDNLVIIGSPYAMLLHSVGESVDLDDTFEVEEEAIQCYTERFDDGEYLAEFRSPFNSRNNLGYVHNTLHPKIKRYFDFGKQIVAVNMNGTDFQDRNNGSDQDSDSLYVTNQKDIVEHAKYCVQNYRTIVNNIPKEKNHYNNTPQDKALVDSKIAAGNMAIGESSNLAQLALTYTYNYTDQKYEDYVSILSVLA